MAARLRLLAAATTGVVVISAFAGLAGAAKGAGGGGGAVAPAPVGIRSAIPLVSGENPMLDPAAPVEADARWTGKVLRLDLGGLDAARYPVKVQNVNRQVVNPCVSSMRIGNLSGPGTLVADPAAPGTNVLSISGSGPGARGDAVSIDITCDWVSRKGVVEHHESHFAGTL